MCGGLAKRGVSVRDEGSVNGEEGRVVGRKGCGLNEIGVCNEWRLLMWVGME